MARRFATEGAVVTIADVDTTPREGGQPTAELIVAEGGSAQFVSCDVSDWSAVDALVDGHVHGTGASTLWSTTR